MNKVSLCLYAHQPNRLKRFYPLEGYLSELSRSLYFDIAQDYSVFMRMHYEKALNDVLEWLEQGNESICLYLSGTFIEQCGWFPELMKMLKRITKMAEPVCSPYYYSLSCSYPLLNEFCHQVRRHISKIEDTFGKTPSIFVNPHFVYSPGLSGVLGEMGIKYVISDVECDGVIPPRSNKEDWSGGVIWMNIASADLYSFSRELEKRRLELVPISELADGRSINSGISSSKSINSTTTPLIHSSIELQSRLPIKNHAQHLFHFELSSLCTLADSMSMFERDIYGRLQQFDILLEMGSSSLNSTIYTLNALSILSDFKRRIWR